jgi:hypothetical protein
MLPVIIGGGGSETRGKEAKEPKLKGYLRSVFLPLKMPWWLMCTCLLALPKTNDNDTKCHCTQCFTFIISKIKRVQGEQQHGGWV